MRRATEAQTEVNNRIDEGRRDDEADQGQLGIGEKDIDDEAEESDRLLEEIAHPRRHRRLDRVGVRHDPTDHLSRGALGEESVALNDEPLVQLIAQIANRGQADFLKGVLREE